MRQRTSTTGDSHRPNNYLTRLMTPKGSADGCRYWNQLMVFRTASTFPDLSPPGTKRVGHTFLVLLRSKFHDPMLATCIHFGSRLRIHFGSSILKLEQLTRILHPLSPQALHRLRYFQDGHDRDNRHVQVTQNVDAQFGY